VASAGGVLAGAVVVVIVVCSAALSLLPQALRLPARARATERRGVIFIGEAE